MNKAKRQSSTSASQLICWERPPEKRLKINMDILFWLASRQGTMYGGDDSRPALSILCVKMWGLFHTLELTWDSR